jgi:hypothetical protein
MRISYGPMNKIFPDHLGPLQDAARPSPSGKAALGCYEIDPI